MATPEETLEKREKELENRVQMLERHLERLSAQIGEEGAAPGAATPVPRKPSPAAQASLAEDVPDISDEVLSWASRNAILPRLATVCFLMVIALILRTITDSGAVNKLIGSAMGMGYAAALMALGWYKYTAKDPLAPVFAVCGAVLMPIIVVETHMHFQSLPLVPAYLTLMATGCGMALMSRNFGTFVPISVGVLGMCFAGAAIDYPHPFFPYLSLVLLTANVLGYLAAQLKRCSWLRWSVLAVTMVMLQLWGVKLGILVGKGATIPPELAPAWYLPVLAVFFLTLAGLSLLGIVNAGSRKISRFDFSVPTLNAIWAFTLAKHVAAAGQLNVQLLGVIGLLAAAGHFTLAFWCARRDVSGTPGTNTFALAGSVLLLLALPTASGAYVLSLPVVSAAAIFLAVMSRVWGNGSVRGTSYLMHIYASVGLMFALRGEGPAATSIVNLLPAGLLTFIIIYQYSWCRSWPPPPSSALFKSVDQHDRSAVLLLVAGLVCAFLMVKIGLYQAMQLLPAADQRDAFRCAQSVIINSSVIGLIVFAYLRRNREIRNVAIFVTLIGGIKVFLYDLLGTHGLPLVFSVFSFGLAAAVESLALGKWSKETPGQDAGEQHGE